MPLTSDNSALPSPAGASSPQDQFIQPALLMRYARRGLKPPPPLNLSEVEKSKVDKGPTQTRHHRRNSSQSSPR